MICFSKDADDDFNLPYILYSDYLKYMNGEFDSTDDETKKYWDEKFKRYAGRISKENCKTHSVNAQWDMISGITDPEIEDMIIVVGAAQNTGKHSSWGKCKHTGYEVTAYSNREAEWMCLRQEERRLLTEYLMRPSIAQFLMEMAMMALLVLPWRALTLLVLLQ